MKPTKRFRQLLAEPGVVVAPGVADAMNARIVAVEGFDAVYMTGSGTSSVRLGMADVGLITMTEMVDNAQRIAESSELPVIADADTGYGGPINVHRTVRAYERAGVAAIHIEDQQWPKRCGHFSGKLLVDADEMANKIKAAVDARLDDDFAIIARTDAYSVEGFESALERGEKYVEAGADIIFVEELRSVEEMEEVIRRFSVPALFNMGGSGKTPFLGVDEIEKLGFKIAIYPNFIMRAAIHAAQELLRNFRKTGKMWGNEAGMTGWADRHQLLRMDEIMEMEQRYGVPDAARVTLK
ncbi:MAG: isocitrate lyase/PEP mutase family protein [Acetobacterales bacterium]